MLYLIGLGLNQDGISVYGLESAKKCKKIYLENYTVDFPYSTGVIGDLIGKKIIEANRDKVESLELIDEAKNMDVALLVYGSPLTATTHMTLIHEAKQSGVRYKIIYNASVFDAVAETGLQLYKFGKIASMPAWKKSYEPDSFMEIVQQNLSMKAHSLILVDIGLEFQNALNQLEQASKNKKVKLADLIVCQSLGTKDRKIIHKNIDELKNLKNIKKPYCIILPSRLHFTEKEFLDSVS